MQPRQRIFVCNKIRFFTTRLMYIMYKQQYGPAIYERKIYLEYVYFLSCRVCKTWVDPENSAREWGILKTFLVINVFHMGLYGPTREAIGPLELLLNGGHYQYFKEASYEHVRFSRGRGFCPLCGPTLDKKPH